jgi:nucleoside-diphosphate-sugar epimerase
VPADRDAAVTIFSGARTLVTGGAGFLGSYLVELLLADGAEVTVADDLSRTGSLANLAEVEQDIQVLRLDLRDRDAAAKACAGQEVVFNLASPVSGVLWSQGHHAQMLTDVSLIAANVIDAAWRAGVRRYIYSSSSCVYPDDAAVPTKESESERGVPEACNEGYGWGKRFGELQSRYYSREYGLEVAIARPFNSYGARQHLDDDLERAQLLPALIGRLLRGDDPFVVWGSGNQTRSLVHGRDTALGIKLLAERHAVCEPVNVGHSRETLVRDLVGMLLEITGRRPAVVFDPTRPEGPPRKGADVSRLVEVTGFEPAIDLLAGLEEMVDYCRERYASAAASISTAG